MVNLKIMNSDQGKQFASEDYIKLLKSNNIKFQWMGKDEPWIIKG